MNGRCRFEFVPARDAGSGDRSISVFTEYVSFINDIIDPLDGDLEIYGL